MDKPITPKKENKELLHGMEISDPYRRLENTQDSETQSWIESQNDYAKSILDTLPSRKILRKEFNDLFRQDSTAFPYPHAGRYFFIKRNAKEEHGILYYKDNLKERGRVLVDPNLITKEKGYPVSLAGYSVSTDGKMITYSLTESSNDQHTLYVMDVDSGKILDDHIPAEFYPSNISWSSNKSGFWYTRRRENVPVGEEKFHRKAYYHRLGTSYAEDKIVYGKTLAKEDIPTISRSFDGRYLVLHVHIASEERIRSEIYILNIKKGEKKFRPVIKGIHGKSDVHFGGGIHRDYFYLQTNYLAPWCTVQRMLLTDLEKGSKEWETVIPEIEGRNLKTVSLIKDRIFVLTLENVHSVLREYSLSGEPKRDIDFPNIGTCMRMAAEPEGSELFCDFESFTYPPTIFRVNLDDHSTFIIDQRKIDYDLGSLQTQQVWFASCDGTKVPMFLTYKRNMKKNGSNPSVLYGYGGFNKSVTPSFNPSIIPFIERGGIYATANLRGGGEFGEEWHKAGTKKQKQNTFDDFISAARWLIDNQYTNTGHLAINGGSNGGLLVGAFMTQEPKLAKAVIMSVPVTDMLRYHLFHGGRQWISDYGSVEDPEMFPYLLKYSPYHNIKDNVEYPATLILTGDKDDRVHPGQAFKITARLQEVNKINPIILRLERNVGHGGASDMSRAIERIIDQWSFIFWQLGIKG